MAFLCAYCDKCCATQAGLAAHSRAKGHPYCESCDRTFVDEDALDKHLTHSSVHGSPPVAHGPPVAPYCERCNRSFVDNNALDQHLRHSTAHASPPSTASSPAPPAPVDWTPPRFYISPGLLLSLQLATDEIWAAEQAAKRLMGTASSPEKTAHDCERCARTFGSAEALLQHEKDSPAHAHAPGAAALTPSHKPKGTNCETCCREFETAAALLQHERDSPDHAQAGAAHATTSVLPPPKAKGQTDCKACCRTFVSAEALRQHETDSPAHNQPITHRGNTYTRLSVPEQSSLYLKLFQSRHSRARLSLENYAFTPTASLTATPKPHPRHPMRKALVLDCEMAGGAGLPDQVVAISVIDFLTGETLLNALVEPSGPITQWRSQITGITRARMAAAVADGSALGGRAEAVARLFELLDQDTVLVGHSMQNDLRVLGLLHGRIVDTGILTAKASGRFGEDERVRRTVGLERLCRELAGVEIRGGGGGGCHNSLEDVLATREVVIWCLRHPEELKAWAVRNWPVDCGVNWGKGGNRRARGGNRFEMERLSKYYGDP